MFFLSCGISTFVGYLMLKPFLRGKKTVVVLFYQLLVEIKKFNTFPKGICPKVNVIERLDLELAYFAVAIHYLNNYATEPSSPMYFAG